MKCAHSSTSSHSRKARRRAAGSVAWADARKGKALEGFRQIRDAHDENTALGMMAGASENLGYAAEALLLHGDWHAAQEQLDQALEIVETYGERIYLPQLLLIEGAIAHARGDPDAADCIDPTRGSERLENKERPGWNCWRSPHCANGELRQTRIDARSPRWSTSSRKQATRPRSPGREPCSRTRSRPDRG